MTPDVSVSWRLPIRLGQAGNTVSDAATWSDSQQAQTFLSARTCYFAALRAEGKELVTQAADLRRLRGVITEYAEAYQVYVAHLLKRSENTAEIESQRTMLELRNILALDTITLDITNHKGERREAANGGRRLTRSETWEATLTAAQQVGRPIFFAMAIMILIVVVHVLMVILVPRTFPTMITGRARRAS